MNRKILIVDDEPSLLQSLRRNLRGKFDLTTAESGLAALQLLRSDNHFAVILSDMQMPEMSGLKLLAEARRIVPDMVRIMMTGNVDQQTAVEAVNDGAVFRFVNKPCPAESLSIVLEDAVRQYQLITAEKELLSKTLTGSIGLINELLSLASPKASGRSGRLRQLTRRMCQRLKLENAWQYEIAAMLSQIGAISCPVGNAESPECKLQTQSEMGSSLIAHIPRLETVAAIIGNQYNADPDSIASPTVRQGARLLRLLVEFDVLCESRSMEQAIRVLEKNTGAYDPEMLQTLAELILGERDIRSANVMELIEGMVVEHDVLTANGDVLISNGHELTTTMIQRLRVFRNTIGVREPIMIRCERTQPNDRKSA